VEASQTLLNVAEPYDEELGWVDRQDPFEVETTTLSCSSQICGMSLDAAPATSIHR
jgi:hypothetical protein